jgi:uncharacterized protein
VTIDSIRLWVDVDNPPQARYLLPIARRFQHLGHEVVVTARAYGETLDLLDQEGATFEAIGSGFGKGLHRKVYGLWSRARQLRAFVAAQPRAPTMLLTGSRAATLAARSLGLSSFVVVDYEYADQTIYRLSGSYIVYPDVIDPVRFGRPAFRASKLLPFSGLKEDLSFADRDVSAAASHDFGISNWRPRILFRPPAEESHYFRRESRDLAMELLRFLAAENVTTVFSPRIPGQVGYVDKIGHWVREPIIVQTPLPSVALLKGVDAVVSAGGTMIREAAYLGIPAYTIFRSKLGAVDRHLASLGRLSIIDSAAKFPRINLTQRPPVAPLRTGTRAIDEVTEMMLHRAKTP